MMDAKGRCQTYRHHVGGNELAHPDAAVKDFGREGGVHSARFASSPILEFFNTIDLQHWPRAYHAVDAFQRFSKTIGALAQMVHQTGYGAVGPCGNTYLGNAIIRLIFRAV